MTAEAIAQAKARAARAAVDEIEHGMLVGLGTGSTAAFAIAALGERVAQGLRIRAVATSLETERRAGEAGITVLPFDDMARVDLAIDGADEVDPALRAIKGAGGALLREKIVAQAATRMICIVDEGKLVDRLGEKPVPVEVLPFARAFVSEAVRTLGGEAALRVSEGRPMLTDQGNMLLDCRFGPIADPAALARDLDAVPGLLDHGLFLTEIDLLLIGGPMSVTRRERVATS